jgi:hypothetical protein
VIAEIAFDRLMIEGMFWKCERTRILWEVLEVLEILSDLKFFWI